jgi:hypothetical protein
MRLRRHLTTQHVGQHPVHITTIALRRVLGLAGPAKRSRACAATCTWTPACGPAEEHHRAVERPLRCRRFALLRGSHFCLVCGAYAGAHREFATAVQWSSLAWARCPDRLHPVPTEQHHGWLRVSPRSCSRGFRTVLCLGVQPGIMRPAGRTDVRLALAATLPLRSPFARVPCGAQMHFRCRRGDGRRGRRHPVPCMLGAVCRALGLVLCCAHATLRLRARAASAVPSSGRGISCESLRRLSLIPELTVRPHLALAVLLPSSFAAAQTHRRGEMAERPVPNKPRPEISLDVSALLARATRRGLGVFICKAWAAACDSACRASASAPLEVLARGRAPCLPAHPASRFALFSTAGLQVGAACARSHRLGGAAMRIMAAHQSFSDERTPRRGLAVRIACFALPQRTIKGSVCLVHQVGLTRRRHRQVELSAKWRVRWSKSVSRYRPTPRPQGTASSSPPRKADS